MEVLVAWFVEGNAARLVQDGSTRGGKVQGLGAQSAAARVMMMRGATDLVLRRTMRRGCAGVDAWSVQRRGARCSPGDELELKNRDRRSWGERDFSTGGLMAAYAAPRATRARKAQAIKSAVGPRASLRRRVAVSSESKLWRARPQRFRPGTGKRSVLPVINTDVPLETERQITS